MYKAGTSHLNQEKRLFKACRVLFGPDVELSREFLYYLQDDGVTSAYRRRAMKIHPDRALISGLSMQKSKDEFVSLQLACKILREHIAARGDCSFADNTPHTKPLNRSFDQPIILPKERLLFGRFLCRMGIIRMSQLIAALTWQKQGRPRIGELGVDLGYLDRASVIVILKESVTIGSFGRTAQNLGYLTTTEVRELLLRQKSLEKKIGQFFIEKDILSGRDLEILLDQCKAHNRQVEMLGER